MATEQAIQVTHGKAKIAVSAYVATEEEALARPETRESIATLREVADADPALALVGFRIGIEKRLRELAERHQIRSTRCPLARIAQELAEKEVLSRRSLGGLQELVQLGNNVAHGAAVNREAAARIIDEGVSILNALDMAIHGK